MPTQHSYAHLRSNDVFMYVCDLEIDNKIIIIIITIL